MPRTAQPVIRRALAPLLLGMAISLPGLARADALPPLPDFGDVSGNLLTPAAERRLGQAFMRSVRASEKVLDDPLLTDYLSELGKRLTRHTTLGEDAFHFFLVQDPSINAFAGPGGYIGVHTGLITTSESESELAAVLAHEIAHVTQHHLARTWQAASDMSVPQAALLIAAVALGATVGADAGIAAAMGGQAAILQKQINFTRANEQEADRVGIDLLSESGFDPRAMASFFTRMGRANRDSSIQLPEFLRTHPITTNRVAEAMDRAMRAGYRQPSDDLRYQLVRARLEVLQAIDPGREAADLQRALDDGRFRNRDATRYGLALALAADRRAAEALKIARQLLKDRPGVLEYAVAAAEFAALTDDRKLALEIVTAALQQHQGNLPLMLLKARLLREDGQLKAALDVAQQLVTLWPGDPRALDAAAPNFAAAGQKVTAYEYLAKAHFLRGNVQGAVRQLEIALKTPGIDFFNASRLESQLESYRSELALIRAGQ